MALSSATAALHLALMLVGVGREDEVIVPSFTYAATSNPVLYCGATPVMVDCEPDSYNMSAHWLEVALQDRIDKGKKPKAVILAHIYGHMADAQAILEVCNRYQVLLFEDAAEAMGAWQAGRQAGTWGMLGVYSFNGNKLFTTGGGGALVSQWPEPVKTALHWATQATLRRPWYEHKEVGYNYRMPHLSAAIGLAQLELFDAKIKRRREIHDAYAELLSSAYDFLPEKENTYSTHWLTVAHSRDRTPSEVLQALEARNIEARHAWKPLYTMPLYSKYPYYGEGNDQRHFDTGICLPSGNAMTPEDMGRVIEVLLG